MLTRRGTIFFWVMTFGATPADIVVTTGSTCVFVRTTSKREAN